MLIFLKFAITYFYLYLRHTSAASMRGDEQIINFTLSIQYENYYHHACVLFQQKLERMGISVINLTEEKCIDSGMILKLSNFSYIFDHNFNCKVIEIPEHSEKFHTSIYFYPSLEIRSKYLMKIPLNDELITNLFCHELDLIKKGNIVMFRKKEECGNYYADDIHIPIFNNLKKMFRAYDSMYPRLSERQYKNLTMSEYHFQSDPFLGLNQYIYNPELYPGSSIDDDYFSKTDDLESCSSGWSSITESSRNESDYSTPKKRIGKSKTKEESTDRIFVNDYSSRTDDYESCSSQWSSSGRLNMDESKGAVRKKKIRKTKTKKEKSADRLFTQNEGPLVPEEQKYSELECSTETLFNCNKNTETSTDTSSEYFNVSNRSEDFSCQDKINPDIQFDRVETYTEQFIDTNRRELFAGRCENDDSGKNFKIYDLTIPNENEKLEDEYADSNSDTSSRRSLNNDSYGSGKPRKTRIEELAEDLYLIHLSKSKKASSPKNPFEKK
ncbi:hypothetical protein DMUE_2537 [Dictyocoela muelleri]|nr:hypothetical protein DMUE_2537 [Dictyocoela muelleri]